MAFSELNTYKNWLWWHQLTQLKGYNNFSFEVQCFHNCFRCFFDGHFIFLSNWNQRTQQQHYYKFNSTFTIGMLCMRTHRREWLDRPLDTLSRPTGRDEPGPKSKWTVFWECQSPRPQGASPPLIIHTNVHEFMIYLAPCIPTIPYYPNTWDCS